MSAQPNSEVGQFDPLVISANDGFDPWRDVKWSGKAIDQLSAEETRSALGQALTSLYFSAAHSASPNEDFRLLP